MARIFATWSEWAAERFERYDIPETELEPVYPGSQLPGGLLALYDGRWRNETPLWLPEQRVIVFADALTAPGGVLRVWATPWHERVIVSHGEPVHTRADDERALERTRTPRRASRQWMVEPNL